MEEVVSPEDLKVGRSGHTQSPRNYRLIIMDHLVGLRVLDSNSFCHNFSEDGRY